MSKGRCAERAKRSRFETYDARVPRQPRVTTRTGDDGRTSLWGAARVPKHDPRIVALGDLDEAQSAMGLARALSRGNVAKELLALQRVVYEVMAEVGTSPERAPSFRATGATVVALEAAAERVRARVRLAPEFVVPGSNASSAATDVARTVVRRAERTVVRLLDEGHLENRELIRVLNRLSDVLYLLARASEGRRRVAARS